MGHRAVDCQSKWKCKRCLGNHSTLVCTANSPRQITKNDINEQNKGESTEYEGVEEIEEKVPSFNTTPETNKGLASVGVIGALSTETAGARTQMMCVMAKVFNVKNYQHTRAAMRCLKSWNY
jgi:hypothetical protein